MRPKMQDFRLKIGSEPFNVKADKCDGRFLAYNTCETLEASLVQRSCFFFPKT